MAWHGPGAVLQEGGGWADGVAASRFCRDLLRRCPQLAPFGPPTCPCNLPFVLRSTLADVQAVMEVFEHSVCFFAGLVYQVEATKEQRHCGA